MRAVDASGIKESSILTSRVETWNRLKTVFEGVSDPLLLVHGPHLEILEANRAAQSLFGLSSERLAGRRLEEFVDAASGLVPASILKAEMPQEVVLRKNSGSPALVEVLCLRVPESVDVHFLRLKDLSDEQERRLRRRQLQYSLLQMSSASDADYLLRFLAQTLVMQFEASMAAVYLNEGGVAKCIATASGKSAKTTAMPIDDAVLQELVLRGVGMSTLSFPDESWCKDPALAKSEGWCCLFGSPIVQGERHVGGAILATNVPMQEEDVEALEALCGQAAITYQQVRLLEQRPAPAPGAGSLNPLKVNHLRVCETLEHLVTHLKRVNQLSDLAPGSVTESPAVP